MQEDSDSGKNNHFKGSRELALTVFPKSAEVVKPAEEAFHNPALGKENKFVQFIPLNNLHISATRLMNRIGKFLTRVSTVNQKFLYTGKLVQIKLNHFESAVSVRYICSSDIDRVRESHGIDNYVALYSGSFFPAS